MNFNLASSLLTTGAEGASGFMVILIQMLPLVLVLVIMYFMLIRPQRKKEKKVQEMRNSLQVGDEVITRGGVIGRVVSLREDTLVIETGSDRSKIRIKRWAIESCETVHDEV
ncbi:MAG: preprotein translocase subunit YajC [Oscillospiraceae bacterium]|jgi:preprotein translocase subunit YajC|nr:preprotein translocase subunit YajC [Oscillospiraceae bacterium]